MAYTSVPTPSSAWPSFSQPPRQAPLPQRKSSLAPHLWMDGQYLPSRCTSSPGRIPDAAYQAPFQPQPQPQPYHQQPQPHHQPHQNRMAVPTMPERYRRTPSAPPGRPSCPAPVPGRVVSRSSYRETMRISAIPLGKAPSGKERTSPLSRSRRGPSGAPSSPPPPILITTPLATAPAKEVAPMIAATALAYGTQMSTGGSQTSRKGSPGYSLSLREVTDLTPPEMDYVLSALDTVLARNAREDDVFYKEETNRPEKRVAFEVPPAPAPADKDLHDIIGAYEWSDEVKAVVEPPTVNMSEARRRLRAAGSFSRVLSRSFGTLQFKIEPRP